MIAGFARIVAAVYFSTVYQTLTEKWQLSGMDLSNTPRFLSEGDRLAALNSYQILDTPPEQQFDELTRLAAKATGAGASVISLIDETRQWFKSRQGVSFDETPRKLAFCNHVVQDLSSLVVPDAAMDYRFSTNPIVTQANGIRFYAGYPLIVSSGHCLGTICVFDTVPRLGLTPEQASLLQELAALATQRIEARRDRQFSEVAAQVVNATSDAVLAVDLAGAIAVWNLAAEKLFGRSASDVVGQNYELVIPDQHLAIFRQYLDLVKKSGDRSSTGSYFEVTARHADSTEVPVDVSLGRWGHTASQAGFVAIFRDISERRALERDREVANALLDTVVSNLPSMLYVADTTTRKYLLVNSASERLVGLSANEMVGRTDRELFPEYYQKYGIHDYSTVMVPRSSISDSVFTRPDGSCVHLRTNRTLIDGPDRPQQYVLGVAEDVTQIRIAQAEVNRLVQFDSLTGLLNRASYTKRLQKLVQDATPFAMLSIDLDRFKAINDQFGHPAGDAVLMQVGERLNSIIDEPNWVARIGGDEFVAVLVGDNLRVRAKAIADAIIHSTSLPYAIERGVAHAGASVGIVLMPEDGSTMERLRENGDLALYRAKHMGKSAACFFNSEMDASAHERRSLERDLKGAIASAAITLVYQPMVRTVDGQITSVEALARWTHTSRGPIKPDVFISVAEECGWIDELGGQLLNRACRDALAWPAHVCVAVNLSPLQFMSHKLIGTVKEALATSGLSARRLQLEVTERLVIRDVQATFRQLEQLRSMGIQILVDDFGVGYSSLSYFQRFPFDKVKIDKSFVDELGSSRAAKAIIQAVVGLGRQLNMAVVAEGVETDLQRDLLIELGCTHLQGYLFSQPVTQQEISKLLWQHAVKN
jgi:diguanylate cyclase (GGDEF)-like protein/PAS domain S-box-containing protein